MLRIAVPNKGSLAAMSAHMLQEAGYAGRRDSKELHVLDPHNGVEFFFLRPRDIAIYVGSGALDVGITGRDLLYDSASSAREVAALDFGDSTFRFAGPVGRFANISDLAGVRVATSYPGLVGDFLRKAGVNATLIRLDGAVESAVRLGVADAVADVVSTGMTLHSAGLEIFGPVILESTAVLITAAGEDKANTPLNIFEMPNTPETPKAPDNPKKLGFSTLLRRLQGVLVARQFVVMDYDVPVNRVEEAAAICPGVESPTVSPLRDPDWVAVRVMVPVGETNHIMDALYDIGARAILVTHILAARL